MTELVESSTNERALLLSAPFVGYGAEGSSSESLLLLDESPDFAAACLVGILGLTCLSRSFHMTVGLQEDTIL